MDAMMNNTMELTMAELEQVYGGNGDTWEPVLYPWPVVKPVHGPLISIENTVES